MHPPSLGHGLVGGDEDDLAIGIGQAQHQHFGNEFTDLAGREIDDGQDLASDQSLGRIMAGDLGR